MRGLAQRLRGRTDTAFLGDEYGFLVGRLLDRATLDRAQQEAQQSGVATHAVLIASGWISQADYAGALALALGIEPALWDLVIDGDSAAMHGAEAEPGLPAVVHGRACRVLSATSAAPSELGRRAEMLRSRGHQVVLAPQSAIDAIREVHGWGDRVYEAVRRLLRERPTNSAGRRTATWQIAAAAGAVGATIGGVFVVPAAAIAALTGLMALPFLCVTLLRLVALRQIVAGSGAAARTPDADAGRLADDSLPVYSVLVPMLREGNVLAGLVQSLHALDYPAAKLDVLLILETDDTETQAALLAIDLPGNFRAIIVPALAPQTKPKALNYALQFARGDFVVVYDAEDRPEPGQLRQALEVFRGGPPDLVCVQAQLNIDNPFRSWLTRQFTIEYSVLFDAILPALERLRLPVPLGGTSNHFPREALVAAGAWDPFNVTEDADLGIRLARQKLRTSVLSCTTWEEAPVDLSTWLKQRTRWLKGWMQTYLVHTREPRRMHAELGWRGSVGFHALMGGLILSALVHPLFYGLLVYFLITGDLLVPAESKVGAAFWAIAWVNLGVGYVVSILIGMLSVCRRRRFRLVFSCLLMPAYWLLISLAAYRALYQLIRKPYLWEKTEHRGEARRPSLYA